MNSMCNLQANCLVKCNTRQTMPPNRGAKTVQSSFVEQQRTVLTPLSELITLNRTTFTKNCAQNEDVPVVYSWSFLKYSKHRQQLNPVVPGGRTVENYHTINFSRSLMIAGRGSASILAHIPTLLMLRRQRLTLMTHDVCSVSGCESLSSSTSRFSTFLIVLSNALLPMLAIRWRTPVKLVSAARRNSKNSSLCSSKLLNTCGPRASITIRSISL